MNPAVHRTTSSSFDQEMMRRAMALARKGWGRTWPNPLVGAVITRNEMVVAEGWHAGYGELHAETMALRQAGDAARGATLYVTLEPCNHQGRQPPCAPALIQAGIARVVIGMPDPNPTAQGGMRLLRQAGLKVDSGLLTAECRRENFRFVHHFSGDSRPFTAIKLAVSMDGRIADSRGHSRWISGASARAWVHHERAGFGAIGVGASTVLSDDPLLTVRGELQPGVAPTRVIFDRSGRISPRARIFLDIANVPVIVATESDRQDYLRDLLSVGARVLHTTTLDQALEQLSQAGVDSILIEGGGRLAGALLAQNLVSRIYQVQAPVWLGETGVPAWGNQLSTAIETAPRWCTVDRQTLDDDTLIVMEPRCLPD